MLELMRIVGVSAVLSAGFVTASEMPGQPAQETVSGKTYTDRLPEGEPLPVRVLRAAYPGSPEGDETQSATAGKGDLLRKAPQRPCASQAWPNIAPDCLAAAQGTPVRNVRMITVEQREEHNTSVLVRMPAPEIAQR